VRHRFVVAAGEYRVQVGADAATVLREGALTFAGDPADTALSLESTVAEWFGHPAVGPVLVAALTEHAPAQPERDPDEPDPLKMIDSMPMGRFLSFTGLPVPTEFLDDLMARSRGGA
jgi:beta-glucosidase